MRRKISENKGRNEHENNTSWVIGESSAKITLSPNVVTQRNNSTFHIRVDHVL
jgi:hypothetical protein